MTRLEEVETRLSAIKSEIETDGADITSLSAETDTLLEERTKLLGEIETRKQTLAKVSQMEGKPVMEEKRIEAIDENALYRSAFLKQVRGLALTEAETRAMSTAANSVGAAVPNETQNEILRKIKEHAPLLDEITLLNVAGNVTFAVENSIADAALHTQNSTINASDDTLTSVTLGGYEICKLVKISKSVMSMTIDAFEAWLTDMLSEKIAEKITAYLISGTGSSQPGGIGSITFNTTNSVTVASTASLTEANVQTLFGMLKGNGKGAKILTSRKTLFTDFMQLQNAAKNKLVTDDGQGNYFVYGVPVIMDEDVALHDAYYGYFKKIVGNLSSDVTVEGGRDLDTNGYKYLGSATFDSKVTDTNAFVKLTKTA